MKKLENACRIIAGLVALAMGAALAAGLIHMGQYARWDVATYHDIASYGFSVLFALAIAGGGALVVVNPKIKGVRIW